MLATNQFLRYSEMCPCTVEIVVILIWSSHWYPPKRSVNSSCNALKTNDYVWCQLCLHHPYSCLHPSRIEQEQQVMIKVSAQTNTQHSVTRYSTHFCVRMYTVRGECQCAHTYVHSEYVSVQPILSFHPSSQSMIYANSLSFTIQILR